MTLLILVSFWTNEDQFLLHPYLLKVSSPFVYLIFPLAYLFQEFVLFPEKKFKPIDLLHFLPFLLNLVELIPVYLSPTEIKLELIKEIIQKKSYLVESKYSIYLIKPAYHQFIRLTQYSIYSVLIGSSLYAYIKHVPEKQFKKNIILVSWLVGVFILKVFSIIVSVYFVFSPHKNAIVFNWQDLLKIVDHVVLAFILFYHPKMLDITTLKGESFKQNTATNSFEKIETEAILFHKIENIFEQKHFFLDENLSPQTIAEALDIPNRKVSTLIKTFTNLTFPDYVNLKRLNYIEEQMKTSQEWRNFTFETMALESGFGSRSNFYNAFKKLKKNSPKTYFGHIKLELEK
ncbi:helix-turn-helix domain-containing protein [Aquirufa sp. ROCK-SH2]